jgi:phosphatidate cytidylyltransferase
LALRIITGIIGIIISSIVIQVGGAVFAGVAVLLALIGWYEYSVAFNRAGMDTAFFLGAFTLVLILCCAWLGNIEELVAILTLGSLAIFLLTVVFSMRPNEAGVSVGGLFYLGLPFAHLIMLRFLADEPHKVESLVNFHTFVSENVGNINFFETLSNLHFDGGCELVWILFACTWASDTFAYFIGSAVGSHRLAPSISPNKTVEGFLGSLVGTALTAVVVGTFLFGYPITQMATAGIILAIVATLGDLVESAIKRFTGVKDSGIIIPGHGGVLDRFDSILYTAPVFYYFIVVSKII